MLNIEKYADKIKEQIANGEKSMACAVQNLKNNGSYSCQLCRTCEVDALNWLLQEYKESILTDKEKAYLKRVIEPRRDEITLITKNWYCPNTESEFTTIEVYVKNPWVDINKNDRTCPNYRLLDLITTEDMPFNGMKLFEYYTLKDLEL